MQTMIRIIGSVCVLLPLISVAQNDAVPVVDADESAHKPSAVQQYVVAEENEQPLNADDLATKVETLQQELQTLRGQLEVQSHQLKVLREQQTALYKDLDDRLQATSKGTQLSVSPASSSKADPEGRNAYRMAYGLVRAKQYMQAISALEQFVAAYPKSHFLPNAHYWLGELYLSQTQYDKAIAQFSIVIQQYPKSNKVAGSHLKLAFAHYDKSDWPQARKALQQVKQQYPDTSVAQVAKAKLFDMERQGL